MTLQLCQRPIHTSLEVLRHVFASNPLHGAADRVYIAPALEGP